MMSELKKKTYVGIVNDVEIDIYRVKVTKTKFTPLFSKKILTS